MTIRFRSFHELMILYGRTLNRIKRENKSNKNKPMNNFKKNVADRDNPDVMGAKYGYHTTKDGRKIPMRPAIDWY